MYLFIINLFINNLLFIFKLITLLHYFDLKHFQLIEFFYLTYHAMNLNLFYTTDFLTFLLDKKGNSN
jgi:hypothetical protein